MRMRKALGLTAAGLAPLAVAAADPSVLSQITPGLWEFSGPSGAPPRRVCIGEPAMIAQIEHRKLRCARSVVRNDPSTAVIDYSCRSGDFGNSKVTVLTPRSMRIETQGISANAPFSYVVRARRVGDCPKSH